MTKRHEDQLPGPAHYMPKEKNKKEIAVTSTFKSTTGRLKTPTEMPAVSADDKVEMFLKHLMQISQPDWSRSIA